MNAPLTCCTTATFPLFAGYLELSLRNKNDAEEVAQEVFLKVFRATTRGSVKPREFRGWLFTIARRAALDRLRRAGRQEPHDPATLEQRLDDRQLRDGDAPEPHLAARLRTLLTRLPEAQQRVLVLRYTVGLTPQETATALEITVEAVRQHQCRALTYLRGHL